MRIAFFAYAWGPGGRLDGYLSEVVNAYLGLGFDVDVFLGNYFSADGGVVGFTPGLSIEALASFVRAQGYVGAVSINNALVTPQIVQALEGRLVSVIVDGFNHLFRHDADDPYAAFRLDVHFAPIGSQFERDILALAPGAAARLTMLSPATNGMLSPRSEVATRHPITWIASLSTDAAAEDFMTLLVDRPADHALAALCLAAIEDSGDLAAVRAEHGERVDRLARRVKLSPRGFEMMLQDMVTARQRIELVDRLARHGLALFGNRAWARAAVLNRGVFQAFQPGPPVRSHDEVLRVYNRSKISVNLPQAFITESFQYRLLDIMASNALLVTRRTPRPDLHRVFGADLPVPMFDTLGELEAICVHYLNNEQERRDIVERCNTLVDESFSFRSRCLDYLRLMGAGQALARGAPEPAASRTVFPADIA